MLLPHHTLHHKVEEKRGHYHLTLAGWSSRNPELLKDYFDEIKELATIPPSPYPSPLKGEGSEKIKGDYDD